MFKRFNKKEQQPKNNNEDEGNKIIDRDYNFTVSGVQCKSKLPQLDNMVFNNLDELDIYLKSEKKEKSTIDVHQVLLELLCELNLPMITVEGVLRVYDNRFTFEGTKLGGLSDLSQQALTVTKYNK